MIGYVSGYWAAGVGLVLLIAVIVAMLAVATFGDDDGTWDDDDGPRTAPKP